MGTLPMYEWKAHVKCVGMFFYQVVHWAIGAADAMVCGQSTLQKQVVSRW